MYCDYCGYSYIKKECVTCGGVFHVCGCDCASTSCEEHYCVECGEPHLCLDEYGVCEDCNKGENDV